MNHIANRSFFTVRTACFHFFCNLFATCKVYEESCTLTFVMVFLHVYFPFHFRLFIISCLLSELRIPFLWGSGVCDSQYMPVYIVFLKKAILITTVYGLFLWTLVNTLHYKLPNLLGGGRGEWGVSQSLWILDKICRTCLKKSQKGTETNRPLIVNTNKVWFSN